MCNYACEVEGIQPGYKGEACSLHIVNNNKQLLTSCYNKLLLRNTNSKTKDATKIFSNELFDFIGQPLLYDGLSGGAAPDGGGESDRLHHVTSRMMRAVGLRPSGSHWLANLAAVSLTAVCISMVFNLTRSLDNLQSLIDTFGPLCTCLLALLKLLSLRIQTTRWRSLINGIRTLEDQQRAETILDGDYESDDEGVPLCDHSYIKRIGKFCRILTIIYLSTLAGFSISPFIEVSWRYFRQGTWKSPHVLPVFTPVDEPLYLYWLFVTLELVGSVYAVGLQAIFDVATIGCMIFLSGQFQILRTNLERVAGSGRSSRYSEKQDRRAHMRIIACHTHHVTLSRLNSILDSILKPVMAVYINLTTLTLCCVAVQLTTKLSKLQLLSLLQYLFANLTQLYLVCVYADSALQQSNMGAAAGAYGAAWWSLSPRTRRELTILAVGTSQPLRLHAGWFSDLNLPTFLSILQTAYSFYAVVQNNHRNRNT